MGKRKQIEESVERVLKEYKEARGNDDVLYVLVCEDFYTGIKEFKFGIVMRYRQDLNIPSYSSVSRARRRLQAEHEELKPSEKIY